MTLKRLEVFDLLQAFFHYYKLNKKREEWSKGSDPKERKAKQSKWPEEWK